MYIGVFWVVKVDVYEMLVEEKDFGILVVVFEIIIFDLLYVWIFYKSLCILREIQVSLI